MIKLPPIHKLPREEKNTIIPEGSTEPVVFRKKQSPPVSPRTGRRCTGKMRKVDLYNGKFKPTNLMIEFVNVYLRVLNENNGQAKTIGSIFREELKKSDSIWYYWQKKPGFTQWFLEQRQRYHSTIGVANVHDAILKNALADSAADRKLHLERFDPLYKPKNEQSFVFVGSRPREEVSDSDIVEQSKKRIESLSKTVVN